MAGGPLDIYEQNPTYRPKFMPDMSGFFQGPVATGAWLATDMWLIPKYLSGGGLMRSVPRDLRRNLMSDVMAVTGGRSSKHFQNYMRGFTESGFAKRSGYASFGEVFGKTAARKVGLGRLASSFSRFGLWYMAAEIGMSLGGMLGDAIVNYTPPQYQNKRRQLETGGAFVDTRYAQTQRMRAIQAIHNTQLSTRAALGNEASFLHLER